MSIRDAVDLIERHRRAVAYLASPRVSETLARRTWPWLAGALAGCAGLAYGPLCLAAWVVQAVEGWMEERHGVD